MFRFKFTASPCGGTVGVSPRALWRARSRASLWSLLGVGVAFSSFYAFPAGAKTAKAKVTSARPKASGAPSVVESSSALAAGDVISVTVLRHSELSSDALTIPASGQINLPEAGAVRVAGQNPTQAARIIARALSRTLVDPEVTVELKQRPARHLSVTGAVAKPGIYDIGPSWRVTEALAAAGGLAGRADETTLSLTRRGQAPVLLNLAAIQNNPASPQNRALRPDDVLTFVAQESRRVTVSGDVVKPDSYLLRRAPRLSDALNAAGGLKGRPDETTATLTRAGGAPVALDVEGILNDPSSRDNIALKAGDVLTFLQRDPKSVTVSGDVAKTGTYPLRSARRLLDALTAAGGTKEGTARTHVTLFRDGQEIALDLAQAESQNTPQTNIALRNGDFLLVKSVPLLQVSVAGSGTLVRNPGNFQLLPASSAVQAVAQAGGLTVNADQVVASVRRGTQGIPFDFARAVLDPRADVALQNGDTVLINEPAIIRIQIAGAVNKQGALRMAPGTTLLDAINSGAGGLSVQPEEVRIAVVRTRSKGASVLGVSTTGAQASLSNALDAATSTPKTEGDREVIAVDAIALLRGNDLRQNVALQDGDLVSVTQIKNPTVIISGQVRKTGPFQIAEGEGVAQLLARAGGQTDDAALTRVVLQRGGQSRVLDVYNEVTTGQKPSVTLQDGDTVIVPENTARVTVMNAVLKPGSYAIPENHTLTITDAINQAGGARDRGIKEVGLLRPNPRVAGGVEKQIVSLDKLYKKGDLSQNVALRPGDIVYVPDAKAPRAGLLGSLGQVIGTLTGLRYLGGY